MDALFQLAEAAERALLAFEKRPTHRRYGAVVRETAKMRVVIAHKGVRVQDGALAERLRSIETRRTETFGRMMAVA